MYWLYCLLRLLDESHSGCVASFRADQRWRVQHDAFCVAASLHCLLLGKYIDVQQVEPLDSSGSRKPVFKPCTAVPASCERKRIWDRYASGISQGMSQSLIDDMLANQRHPRAAWRSMPAASMCVVGSPKEIKTAQVAALQDIPRAAELPAAA